MGDNSPAAIATNPDAPAAERYDAQVEVHGRGIAELIPSPDIQAAIDQIQDSWRDAELSKSLSKGQVIPFPPRNRGARGGQSVFLDDFQVSPQGDYWDRPGILGFDSMRAMVEQTPILNAIVLTRVRQVLRFCRPVAKQADIGFSICHVDDSIELNDEQQQSTQLLEKFFVNAGWETDPRRRKRLKRDNFAGFMAKSVRDTLTMDACPIETEFKRDRTLGLDGFYALDGASIRLCTEEGYQGDDEIYAVQVLQGRIRTAYTYDDLVYEVRNPRTDVTASGYGYGECEMLVRVVTYLLNTMTYNGAFFDKNAIPRGILNIFGNYDQADLAAFKRYWNAMVRGAQNSHGLPIMASKDQESGATFTEIGGQLNEMAFGKWISLLQSLACSIYGIAPEEVSMESFAASKSALSGSDTEQKLVSSNDKGLRPLLGFYENTFSDYVIQPFSEQYMFRFIGLDGDDEEKRFEMRKLVSTVNEGRAYIGDDPMDGPLGDAPINPSLLPAWQAVTGVGQPTEDFGDPDAEDATDQGAGPPGAEAGPPGATEGAGAGAPFGTGEGGSPAPPADGAAPFGKALGGFGLPIFKIEA